jgi:hypothetical protein
LLHEGRFGIQRTDDGVFVFTRPNGKRIPECGPRPGIAISPTAAVAVAGTGSHARSNDECFRGNNTEAPPVGDAGLAQFEESLKGFVQVFAPDVPIDAGTARCKWLGERMDYSTAIEGLQFLEHGCWVNGKIVERVRR